MKSSDEILRFLTENMARLAARYSGSIALVSVMLTIVSLFFALKLTIEKSEVFFFPSAAASQEEKEILEELLGGTGYILGIIESGDREKRRAFADEWVRALNEMHNQRIKAGKSGLLRFSVHRLPTTFFLERRLLYLDYKDIQDIKKRVKERIEQERRKINPFYVDLEEEETPTIDLSFQDLRNKYGLQKFQEYSESHFGDMVAVLMKPAKPSYDTGFSQNIVHLINSIGQSLQNQAEFRDIRFSLGGAYIEQVNDFQALLKELLIFAAIVFGLYSLIAASVLRRLRFVFLVWLGTFFSLIWLRALDWALFTTIDTLSLLAFLAVLSISMAWNHLVLYRYKQKRRQNLEPIEAMRNTMKLEGRIIVPSAILLCAGLGVFSMIEVIELSRFCLTTLLGVLLSGFVALLVLPSFLLWLERSYLTVIPGKPLDAPDKAEPMPNRRVFVSLAALLSGLGLFFLLQSISAWSHPWCDVENRCCQPDECHRPIIDFEHDYRDLGRALRKEKKRKLWAQMAYQSHVEPLIVFADSKEGLRAFLEHIKPEIEAGSSLIRYASSIYSIMPMKQDEKRKVLASIDEEAIKGNIHLFDKKTRQWIKEVRPLLHPANITLYELPIQVIRAFSSQPPGSAGLFYLLSKCVRRLPPSHSKEEWRLVMRGILEQTPFAELQSIAKQVSPSLMPNEFDTLELTNEKLLRRRMLAVLQHFDKHHVGTVGYLYPSVEPLISKAAIGLLEKSEKWRALFPSIIITGKPIFLGKAIRDLPLSWMWIVGLTVFSFLLILILFLPNLRLSIVMLFLPFMAFSALTMILAILGVKWNLYTLMFSPILLGLCFEFGVRVYWCLHDRRYLSVSFMLSRTMKFLLLSSACFGVPYFAVLASNHRGLFTIGTNGVISIIIIFAISLTLFPAIYETLRKNLKR